MGAGPMWKKEQIEFVQENVGKMSYAAIGKALGRSASAIQHVVARQGFPQRREPESYIGEKYNQLEIVDIERVRKKGGQVWAYAWCRCDCGRSPLIKRRLRDVYAGKSKCCEICDTEKRTERIVELSTTHGESGTRLYRIWTGMINRCTNKNSPKYKWYGAKGVTVCEEWLNSYEAFRDWSLANGYGKDLTLDRFPDNEGNYGPTNCRWATMAEQNLNKCNNRFLTAFGETKTCQEWVRDDRCVVNQSTLNRRLTLGWTHEDAISIPTYPRRHRTREKILQDSL